MSSKTKIVVLKMKEIIYTAIFIGLAIVLITLFLIMFRPKNTAETGAAVSPKLYNPGIYSASLAVGGQNINVEVAVDHSEILSVSFVSLDEAVTTMYPLMEPVMKDLEEQILKNQSLTDLSYSMETRYTSQALINAIETALGKAKIH